MREMKNERKKKMSGKTWLDCNLLNQTSKDKRRINMKGKVNACNLRYNWNNSSLNIILYCSNLKCPEKWLQGKSMNFLCFTLYFYMFNCFYSHGSLGFNRKFSEDECATLLKWGIKKMNFIWYLCWNSRMFVTFPLIFDPNLKKQTEKTDVHIPNTFVSVCWDGLRSMWC